MSRVPESIGKYKIVELLATGGMGAVYKGMHPTLERHVILKKLTLRGNPDFAARFRREARILMGFRNDNIVDVYDHFKEGRSHYIVLEYIDGLSLEELIRRERYLPNDMALYICYQVAKALAYAHNRQVIHRDIKPANILLSSDGDVKLVDFGIASSKEDGEEGLTLEGMTLGSPSYMAPEQFENSRNVDKRADVYSLGVMLFESVTGKKPYPGGFSADLIAAISKGKHPAPGKLNPKVNRTVRKLIKKTMHPKRKRRYQDMEPIIRLLNRYFRKRPKKALREQLQGAVVGKQVEPVATVRRSTVGRTAAVLCWTVFFAAAVFAAGYFSGWYQRLFLADDHGELKVELRVDGGYKMPEDYYLRAWLFSDTGDDGTELETAPLRFRLKERSGGDGEVLSFSSRRYFLPAGAYRIKVQMENSLYWSTFNLRPMAAHTLHRRGDTGRTLVFSRSPRQLPLFVDFFVQDQDTWEEITDSSTVEVLVDGEWTVWSDGVAELMHSGAVYRFRISAVGYDTKSFSLLIREDQQTLYLNPRLKKLDK